MFTKLGKRKFDVTVGWIIGSATITVRAYTRRGAEREAYRMAKVLKPLATVAYVGVFRSRGTKVVA